MLFPDYGSQYVGMGKELYDSSRLMQEYFEEASNCLSINFVKLCFASSEIELASIANAYPSIFLLSSALAGVLKEQGIVPDIVAGCGLGEYAAIHTAGGLTLPDGLYFLSKFAQFYQELLATVSVRAIALSQITVRSVKKICTTIDEENQPYISVYYSDNYCVVVGDDTSIEQVKELAVKAGARCQEALLESGLHSMLMEQVATQLRIYVEKIDFHDLKVPLLANVDGKTVSKGTMVRDRIIKQITQPIRWDMVLHNIKDWDIIVEIGPGNSLQKITSTIYPTKPYFTINQQSDIQLLLDYIAKLRSSEHTDTVH